MPESPKGNKVSITGVAGCPRCVAMPFYGKPISQPENTVRAGRVTHRCVGNDAYRFGGQLCDNPQVRTDRLELDRLARSLVGYWRFQLAHGIPAPAERFRDQPAEWPTPSGGRPANRQTASRHRPFDRRLCRGLSRPRRSRASNPTLQKNASSASKPKPSNGEIKQHVQLQLVIGRLENSARNHHGPGAIRLGWTSGVDPVPWSNALRLTRIALTWSFVWMRTRSSEVDPFKQISL